MTSTVNGIGTHLSGERKLTDEEFNKWSENFPYNPNITKDDYRIATESFVILLIPIIPLKTFVYYYIKRGFQSHYRIIFHPAGEGKIYWEHVKKGWVFYIAPILIAILVFYFYILPYFKL